MSHQLIEKNLSETASLSEQQEFERWPNDSDKNLKYFNKTKVIWNSLDEAFLTKKFNKDSAQINISSRFSLKTSKVIRLKRFKLISYAATFILLISLSFWAINSAVLKNQFAQIYTAGNSIEELILEDGSRV
ncbi:MAG: hypothetical protein PF541_04590 [Prolixibacteraceae bacterium]|jgi:ferric-dicitrate binding protein FerR (iron transport regulator)|nr:hypothetical protein [Prolixibacteraceae bacterium]